LKNFFNQGDANFFYGLSLFFNFYNYFFPKVFSFFKNGQK
jgi:hypothetical protein